MQLIADIAKELVSTTLKTGVVLTVILAIIVSVLFVTMSIRSFNHEGFPRGFESYSLESPNKENIIHVRGNEGNATGGGYIRVEVESDKKNYTIYFEKTLTPNTTPIEWVDDNSLLINGETIHIEDRIYRE